MNNKNIRHSKIEQLKDDNANKKVLFFAYSSITTSRFFIFFFFVFIVFAILAGVFSTNVNNVDAYIAFTVITIILVIILELYISALLVKAKALSIYYPDPENNGIWILFLVGLFICIVAIVGAFMTISACKTIIQMHDDVDDFEDDNQKHWKIKIKKFY